MFLDRLQALQKPVSLQMSLMPRQAFNARARTIG
jgi:hypothetical protein